MKILKKINEGWKRLGPGIITGASDDDPSGIATYSQAGAAFGLSFLWTALLTYPLMYAIQEMSARIGILGSGGLTKVLLKYYPPIITWGVMILIVPAIIFNIAADLSSIGAVLNLLFPSISSFIFSVITVIISIIYVFFLKYRMISNIFKILCLALVCYFIVPFLVKQDWPAVLSSTFIPNLQWNREYMLLLVAILGTTISPYLFFWQASLSHEQKVQNGYSKASEIQWMKIDVSAGMFASNLAMYFIILTAGIVLYGKGIKIETVEQAASALEPLAGELSFIVFSLGILGVGFLAIPVLAGCIAYMFSDCFHWEQGLEKTPSEAPCFYGVIAILLLIALIVNYFGIDPIQSLIWTAILYGIITPPVIALILHICNNPKIMGKHTNSLLINILGVLAFLLMSGAALGLLFVS